MNLEEFTNVWLAAVQNQQRFEQLQQQDLPSFEWRTKRESRMGGKTLVVVYRDDNMNLYYEFAHMDEDFKVAIYPNNRASKRGERKVIEWDKLVAWCPLPDLPKRIEFKDND